MSDTRTGACLCGTVRFTTRGPIRDVVFCHCSQCRRQTGLFYAATNVENDRFTVDGAENVSWYQSSADAKRGFCRTCGSALFWKMDSLDHTSIMAGAFDPPSRLAGAVHIFCADKGDFYEIADGLPQYDQSSPDITVADS